MSVTVVPTCALVGVKVVLATLAFAKVPAGEVHCPGPLATAVMFTGATSQVA
ncbi:MAG: hypothetical protein IPP26_01520 [Flavobacteriales bacterium]|nr:hypothetical protein [Flavobacteriales bacterium]